MAHAPEYRRLRNGVVDVDFYRTQATALRRAAMQDTFRLKVGFKIAASTLAIGLAIAAAVSVPKALAEIGYGHTVVAANDIQWSPAPPSIPPGTHAAILHGDPKDDPWKETQ